MAKNNPYVGKITNTGVQNVKVQGGQKTGNSKVKTGNDLRTGGK